MKAQLRPWPAALAPRGGRQQAEKRPRLLAGVAVGAVGPIGADGREGLVRCGVVEAGVQMGARGRVGHGRAKLWQDLCL